MMILKVLTTCNVSLATNDDLVCYLHKKSSHTNWIVEEGGAVENHLHMIDQPFERNFHILRILFKRKLVKCPSRKISNLKIDSMDISLHSPQELCIVTGLKMVFGNSDIKLMPGFQQFAFSCPNKKVDTLFTFSYWFGIESSILYGNKKEILDLEHNIPECYKS